MAERELKCNHNVEHKEVLGHVICVCCSHCQGELSAAREEIDKLRTNEFEDGNTIMELQRTIESQRKTIAEMIEGEQ